MQFSAELEVSPTEFREILHEVIEDEVSHTIRDMAQDMSIISIREMLVDISIEKIVKEVIAGIAKDMLSNWHKEALWQEFQGTGMSRSVFDTLFSNAIGSGK